MPQLDITWYASQCFWVLITFSAMFYVMWRYVLPVMRTVVDGRQRRMEDDLGKAEELKTEAARIMKEYQEAMASAEEKTREQMNKAQKEIQEILKKKEEEFSIHLEEKISEAEEKLLEAKNKAMADVKGISKELTTDISKKLLEVVPQADELEKAVSETMEQRA